MSLVQRPGYSANFTVVTSIPCVVMSWDTAYIWGLLETDSFHKPLKLNSRKNSIHPWDLHMPAKQNIQLDDTKNVVSVINCRRNTVVSSLHPLLLTADCRRSSRLLRTSFSPVCSLLLSAALLSAQLYAKYLTGSQCYSSCSQSGCRYTGRSQGVDMKAKFGYVH